MELLQNLHNMELALLLMYGIFFLIFWMLQ